MLIDRGTFVPFAVPGHDRLALLQLLAGQNFIATAETAVDAFDVELESDGDEAIAALGIAAAASRDNFDVGWSPGVGPMVRGVRELNLSRVRFGIAQSLLHAAVHGVDGQWAIRLSRPARLLGDRILLRPATHLDVEAQAGNLSVTFDGKDTMQLRPSEDPVNVRSADAVLPIARQGGVRVVLPPIGAVEGAAPESLGALDSAAYVEPIEVALELMAEAAPEYHDWIGDVTRRLTLTPVLSPQDAGLSGTLLGDCGTFQAAATHDLLAIGSMLVHGASHQYYNLASRLIAPCDPDRPERFYSPFAQAMRRLDRILLGYHAAANVLVYYHRCVEYAAVTWQEIGAEQLIRDVRSTEVLLNENLEQLSWLGHDLFVPLHARGEGIWRG